MIHLTLDIHFKDQNQFHFRSSNNLPNIQKPLRINIKTQKYRNYMCFKGNSQIIVYYKMINNKEVKILNMQ